MAWSALANQFCLELAFGVLFALAFVPRAPVGRLFYRVLGTAALVPILLALVLPPVTGGAGWTAPPVLLAGVAAALYPVYSGPFRGARWAGGLAVAAAACGAGVAATLWGSPAIRTAPELALATATALATGAAAGTVGLAMVLGHWYLTVPKLEVRHLARLNRVAVGTLAASLVLVAATCLVFGDALRAADRSLFGPTGLFHLGTRIGVGVVMPLVFAALVAGSLRYRNTRSATGILYASTVLVLIGTAVAISLQDAYGVPL